jgi:hypothetical protein
MVTLLLSACGNHPPEIRRMRVEPDPAFLGDDLEVLIEVADREGPLDLVAAWVAIDGEEVARFAEAGVPGTFVAQVDGGDVVSHVDPFDDYGLVDVHAVVTDLRAERGGRTETVRLVCAAGEGYCDGACRTFDTPDHCGDCDTSCGPHSVCDGRRCAVDPVLDGPHWTGCEEAPDVTVDCAEVCAASGEFCGIGCDELDSFATFGDTKSQCRGESFPMYLHTFTGTCVAGPLQDGAWLRCCCGS